MKVYVDELPEGCCECPCCNHDVYYGSCCNLGAYEYKDFHQALFINTLDVLYNPLPTTPSK